MPVARPRWDGWTLEGQVQRLRCLATGVRADAEVCRRAGRLDIVALRERRAIELGRWAEALTKEEYCDGG